MRLRRAPVGRRRERRFLPRTALLAAIVTTAMLGAQPASGLGVAHTDADDSSSTFDLRVVRLYRTSEPNRGVLRARTYEVIDLGENRPYLSLFIDSRGGTEADRMVWATYDGGSSGLMCLGVVHLGRDEYIDDCDLRTQDTMWQISFAWNALRATKAVRWWVEADADAVDRAPDAGSYG